jgi:hypothetical protein
MWYGQSVEGWSPADAGSVDGEMWSAASREEADAKALALKQESGSHVYHVLRYGDFGLPTGTPMTSAERAAAIDDMIANPEKYKRLAFERARRECPWMTEEQHENEWQYAAQLMGLYEPEPEPGPSRELTSLVGPADLDTPEKRKAYAGTLTDEILDLVQAERKRQGLPPLT